MKIYVGTVGTGFEDGIVCVQTERKLAEFYLDLYYSKHESERLGGYYITEWDTNGNKEGECVRYRPKILAGPDEEPCDVWEIKYERAWVDSLSREKPMQIYRVSHKNAAIEETFTVNTMTREPDIECALRIAKGE